MRAKIVSICILSCLTLGFGYLMWVTPDLMAKYISGSLPRLLFLEIPEGACLIAALSLLYEVVFPRVIRVRGISLVSLLSGSFLFSERKDSRIHVCEIFMVRSFYYALGTLYLVGVVATIYLMGEAFIDFLLNPHPIVITWDDTAREFVWTFTVASSCVVAVWGGCYLILRKWNKDEHPYLCYGLCGVYAYVLVSVCLGYLFSLFPSPEPITTLESILLVAAGLGGIGVATGLAFGIFFLVRKGLGALSGKFGVLQAVWANVCPTIPLEVIK